MWFFKSKKNHQDELIAIMELVMSKITNESDMMWTAYDSAEELREEIEVYIAQLRSDDLGSINDLNMHFAPASTFQDHSIQNGWSGEYLKIATKFDKLYRKLKK